MTTFHDRNDPVGPPPAVLNDPAQYEYPTQIDADGFPYIETPGDLGHLIWAPIPGVKNARTGQSFYGPKRVGNPVFTGGRSADGGPTRAKR
ncbi:MAG: hypothetical protein AAFM92_10950 [Pseudomonadota bacterium]